MPIRYCYYCYYYSYYCYYYVLVYYHSHIHCQLSHLHLNTRMHCYGILTEHIDSGGSSAIDWARHNHIRCELHLNRCRYWLPTDSALESEFVLRWTSIIHRVPEHDES